MMACVVCQAAYVPRNDAQIVCGIACARKLPVKRRADAAAGNRARREALKTRSQLTAEAQTAFNAWVRHRDITAGHGCIDCNMPFEPDRPGGSVDAGHYLSRGSAPHLRFDERNVFAQRKNCNRPGGATRAAFRAGVVARIGIDAVEALESDQGDRKLTADDLRAIRDDYRARLRAKP